MLRTVFSRLLVVNTVAILLQASAITAFAQSPEEVLQGRWQLDAARSVKAGGEESRQLLPFFKGLSIELRKDGTTEVVASTAEKPMTQAGTWKVSKSDGESMEIEITTGSKYKEVFKAKLSEAGDYLQLTPDKQRLYFPFVFVLARVKSND